MIIRSDEEEYYDDTVYYGGIGSIYDLVRHAKPKRVKKRHPLGFAIPKRKK